jgi:hypothetical protein
MSDFALSARVISTPPLSPDVVRVRTAARLTALLEETARQRDANRKPRAATAPGKQRT